MTSPFESNFPCRCITLRAGLTEFRLHDFFFGIPLLFLDLTLPPASPPMTLRTPKTFSSRLLAVARDSAMSSPFAPKSIRRESHEENINRDSNFGSRYKPQPVSTNLLQLVTCQHDSYQDLMPTVSYQRIPGERQRPTFSFSSHFHFQRCPEVAFGRCHETTI